MADYDVVIAGGGHNALICACVLAKNGLKVMVVERNAWVGGGVVTREVTLPGFRHDLFGSSHVWIYLNPDFKSIEPELRQHGLKYIWSEDHITGHPNKYEGDGIIVYKDVDKTCDTIAAYSTRDAKRYREIYEEFGEIREGVIKSMFTSPAPPSYLYQGLENNPEGLKRLRDYQLSSRQFALENFENEHVRAFILGWAMAPQTLPDQLGTAAGFYVMIPSIHYFGQAIPEGGSGMLSESMKRYLEASGSSVMTNATVRKFIVEKGECKGLRLEDGTEIMARQAVISSLDPFQTFLHGFDEGILSEDFLRMVRNFRFGDVTIVRVHYALHEAPRFRNGPDMDKTAFQRIFGTVADIDRQYNEMARGNAPSDPFLWTAAWTTMDPTRAPEGKHTLIMDTFVPVELASGADWEDIAEAYICDKLLGQLRNYTTNMTDDNIMAQYVETGPSLARANLCFHRGVTTGGERTLAQLGAFRPFPNYADYRGPVKKLYMTGPSCHPGGGICGMGTIAANEILLDLGIREEDDFDF
ncbi:MAG TPA: NAD(P)/FAD-dependent oxidoreductase [Gammaproteobacteria bacterium]|jgi:phytoene dehydrogenase-like protein|nr:FAD-dependent oxidoreductase [Chromatiales bacterium]MCP4925249.1 NAD(P)/FAD-dependent oxidoreductase [Gammaproteobacteria bacterium]MDP7297181.1 NAD(P)/FAD-dependent oxidoreductase [Gammaproteobacteria bacterium]MDP7660823.1 NAD(P)/FAD-dependent oxidoreductase [Gammaproteobacteria bacterium]HJP40044.1 NAD(P)/FAD-dependent oxidoreductase [Gammaproteobacteria bacterium]